MGTYEWMELQTLTSEIAASRSRLAAARSSGDRGRARALEEEITAAEGRRDRLLAHITTNLVSTPERAERPGRSRGKGDADARKAAEPGAAAQPLAAAADDELSASTVEAIEPAAAVPEEIAEPQSIELVEPRADELTERQSVEVAGAPPAEIEEPAVAEVAEIAEQPSPEIVEQVVAAPPASARKADRVEGGSIVWNQLTPNDIERAKTDLVARRAEMLTRHAEELKALDADQAQLETLEQAIAAFAAKFSGAAGKGGVVELGAERELRQQGA